MRHGSILLLAIGEQTSTLISRVGPSELKKRPSFVVGRFRCHWDLALNLPTVSGNERRSSPFPPEAAIGCNPGNVAASWVAASVPLHCDFRSSRWRSVNTKSRCTEAAINNLSIRGGICSHNRAYGFSAALKGRNPIEGQDAYGGITDASHSTLLVAAGAAQDDLWTIPRTQTTKV